MVGLAAARILVDDYIADRLRSIRENDIRDMHSLILAGQNNAGRYKQYLNSIEGSVHVPIPPVDVPGAMHELTAWLENSEAPIIWRAAVVHAWLTHIHPFDDGNGRMARLLANYVLGFGCYPPLIVRSSSDRPRYLNALAHSDAAGDIVPLVRLFVRVLDRGVKLMEDPEFAWSLFQADLRVREQSLYIRWTSTVDRFLEAVAANLRLSRKDLDVIGTLSAADFDYLSRRDRSGNAWIARVTNRAYFGPDLLIWAGFSSSTIQMKFDLQHSFPSFFISERDTNPKAIRPYKSSVLGQVPLSDELCVVADEDRVILRRGKRISRVKIGEAAELFAALLAGYLDRLA